MEKYKITQADKDYYNSMLNINTITPEVAESNPFVFMRYFLGFKPYYWQSVFIRKMLEHRFLAVVTPRQVGKSLAIEVVALWLTLFNKKPLESTGATRIAIFSATEPQSIKIIDDIKAIMYRGDKIVESLTGGSVKKFFTSQISYKGTNKSVLKFKNGSDILSIPATDTARGYTVSRYFVDEASFSRDPEVLESVIEPTVRKSGGDGTLASTPNGIGGHFYDIIDPEDKRSSHSYERLWFGRDSIEEQDLLDLLDQKRVEAEEKGSMNLYLQEYEAEFTSSISMFFNSKKVLDAVNSKLSPVLSHLKTGKEQIAVSVDFGMSYSRTIVSVVLGYVDNDKPVCRLLNQFAYNHGEDYSLVEDVSKIMKRYDADYLIVDDCAEGYHFIQRMELAGLKPYRFSFRSKKTEAYFSFRNWLNKGQVEYYKEDELLFEMRSLREDSRNTTTKIEHSYGSTDDRIDSFVMGCYAFFEGSGVVKDKVQAILI